MGSRKGSRPISKDLDLQDLELRIRDLELKAKHIFQLFEQTLILALKHIPECICSDAVRERFGVVIQTNQKKTIFLFLSPAARELAHLPRLRLRRGEVGEVCKERGG